MLAVWPWQGELAHFEHLSHSFHSGCITGLSVCIRKPIIATCSLDQSVRIWNSETKYGECHSWGIDRDICTSYSYHFFFFFCFPSVFQIKNVKNVIQMCCINEMKAFGNCLSHVQLFLSSSTMFHFFASTARLSFLRSFKRRLSVWLFTPLASIS